MDEPLIMYRHRFETRLEEPLPRRTLPGFVNTTECEAHRFEVTLLLDGEPCAADNVVGYALRPDGVSVMRPGTVEDGVLCWVLPQEALALPGLVQVMLNAGRGDTTATVLQCGIHVTGTTGPVVDADDVVPTVNRLLHMIGACEDAAAEATEAASEAGSAAARVSNLIDLVVPSFTVSRPCVSCHPLPGSTVTVSATGGTAVMACGHTPWKLEGFVGASTYYQLTGTQTGLDVPLPAGDWMLHFRVHTDSGISSATPVDLFVRRADGTGTRMSYSSASGSCPVHFDEPGALSAWMLSANGGWTAMGKPPVDVLISDGAMPEDVWPAADTRLAENGQLTAPGRGGVLHVWTADGSDVTVCGRKDPVYLLDRLCEAEGWL